MKIVLTLDIAKNDITPDTVRRIVEDAVRLRLEGNGPSTRVPYITLTSAKVKVE